MLTSSCKDKVKKGREKIQEEKGRMKEEKKGRRKKRKKKNVEFNFFVSNMTNFYVSLFLKNILG